MRMPRKTLAAAVTALACAAPAAAASAAPAPADISDADYLAASAQANLFEIATGKDARKQGQSATVRTLGRMFVKDHTAALAQGAAVAKKLGVTPPTTLNPSQQAAVERLAKLRGKKFDRAWLKAQIGAHEAAVQLQLRGALTGDTADTRTLAIISLPVVSVHLGELAGPGM